jgi:hypothetical protein
VSPSQIAAGITIVSAFLGGAWLGRSAVLSDWNAEKAQQAREVVAQMDRAAERRAAADQAMANVQSAVTAALRRSNAPAQPIKCPPSGNALDAVVPGLGDRLRAIDAAAGGGAGAGVAIVPGGGVTDPGR